ncbi:MAG: hypothetical protein QOI83_337, partial [Streptomycetaceae bacterium]|nr:hypothetical protein [Streptomycetaceae bacterium]
MELSTLLPGFQVAAQQVLDAPQAPAGHNAHRHTPVL